MMIIIIWKKLKINKIMQIVLIIFIKNKILSLNNLKDHKQNINNNLLTLKVLNIYNSFIKILIKKVINNRNMN